MPTFAAQMELKMNSNVSADSAVNTLHFAETNVPNALIGIEAAMNSLYDDLNSLYSDDVAQNGHVLKIYNLDDATPRAPAVETTYDFPSAPNTDPLPHQVALCMSFQGDRQSGVAQASRRGRIYLGPLGANLVTVAGRPTTGSINIINNAAEALEAFGVANDALWVVYSPTLDSITTVTNGWCDDTFDIQRRRARDASTRNVWP